MQLETPRKRFNFVHTNQQSILFEFHMEIECRTEIARDFHEIKYACRYR